MDSSSPSVRQKMHSVERESSVEGLPKQEILLSKTLPPLFKSLMPYIKLQIRLCNVLATIPYEWDEARNRIRLLQSKGHMLVCKAQICIHIIYTLIVSGYFLNPANQRTIKHSERMVALTFLVCFGATMFMRIAFWQRRTEIVQLLNNYILFEDTYLPPCQPQYKGDKISRSLMILGFLTSAGLPGFMCTMLLVSPCKAPHMGYILFKGVDGCVVPNWPLRIGVLMFDSWMWANCIPAACFTTFQVFFPGLKCLAFYVQLVISVFRGPVEPLFKDNSSKDRFCFHVYRHIRILGKLHNFCLQTIFIPAQITAGCLVLIIGLFTCIKLHADVPMPGFAFFPLISSDGLAVIFISQFAAIVYSKSKSFVNGARRSRSYQRKSWFRKMTRSSHFIKIRFGSTNYIGEMTPLVYINFCLTQTVSLIMLTSY